MAPYSRPFGAEPFGGSRSSNITDLILRRGDIAAQRALDSGAMWGGAIANIGQAVGGMLAQREEQKQLKKRDAALAQLLNVDDAPPEAYVQVMGPEGLKVWTALQAAKETRAKLGRESREDAFKRLPVIAQGFDALPAPLKPGAYQPLRGMLIEAGLASEETAPPEYTPEQVDPYVKSLLPKKEGFTLSPGQKRFEGGQVVAEAPAQAPTMEPRVVGRALVDPTGKVIYRDPEAAGAGSMLWINRGGQVLRIPESQIQPGDMPYESPRGNVKRLPAGEASKLGEIDNGLKQIDALVNEFSKPKPGFISRVGATIPHATEVSEALTGIAWGSDAKSREATIALVKQIIGKGLEDGVLRKEDEKKYEAILPRMSDDSDTVKNKIAGLERALKDKKQSALESFQDAGYDVSAYEARTSAPTVEDPMGIR